MLQNSSLPSKPILNTPLAASQAMTCAPRRAVTGVSSNRRCTQSGYSSGKASIALN